MDCGRITVSIYEEDGVTPITNVPVINKGVDNLYQIPVISYTGVPYGTYFVRINVNAPTTMLGITGSTFYLDAIRIYDPMGLVSDDNNEFDEANEAYKADREANAYVASIRDYILTIDDLGVDEETGAVYVDTIDNDYSAGGVLKQDAIKDFLIVGPNEEVYLTPGKGVGFALVCSEIPETVQLSIKIPAPLTNSAKIFVQTINGSSTITKEVNSADEMFYDITDAVQFSEVEIDGNTYYRAVVVLSNGLDGAKDNDIISVTNVKMTYSKSVTNIVEVKDEDDIIETASLTENENSVATGLLASWNIYCDVFDTVYTQHQATVPSYDVILEKGFSDIEHGDSASAVFRTSQFVDNIIVKDENGDTVSADIKSVIDEENLYTDNYKTAKKWTVTITNPAQGKHIYTVSAACGDGVSVKTELNVAPRQITGLRVARLPSRTDYIYGETIDTSGLKLEATYSDGTVKEIVSGYTLSTQKADRIGSMKVKVSYDGLQTSFKVNVSFSVVRFILTLLGFGWIKIK